MEGSSFINRRSFLYRAGLGAIAASTLGEVSAAGDEPELTILHTNDVHSRIDPFDQNHPQFPGQGGAARRSELIRLVRAEKSNVLVFDSGDIFQGTPYFNLYKGVPEIRLMNHMGYNAATIGNHEFDAGLLNLSYRVREAAFPFVCSNYDFSGGPLNGLTVPWKIIDSGPIRIGVIGLGIGLEGLVDSALYGSTKYLDPVDAAERNSVYLKGRRNCDLVIALSHLGYSYQNEKISDLKLAERTSGVDIILGGHTHTFIDEPVTIKNKSGKNVLICQTGWGGVKLGRIDLKFQRMTRKKTFMISSM